MAQFEVQPISDRIIQQKYEIFHEMQGNFKPFSKHNAGKFIDLC
jgi:hypothetical protein